MKFPTGSLLTLAVLVVVAPLPANALPEGEAAMGRLIARRFADAIVSVKGAATVKITVGDRAVPPMDQKFEVNGTVITPAGLTVTSLNAIDPHALYETRAKMGSGGLPVTLGKTEFKALKIRLDGGTEVPVRIVWKDADQDVVLLLPETPSGRTFTFVNLNDAPEGARLLGDYFQLSRTAEPLQRVLLVRAATVTGILERPRRRLLVSTDLFEDSVGCPIFDEQGKVLGINLRSMEDGLPKGSVVLPATDLVTLVAQNAPAE